LFKNPTWSDEAHFLSTLAQLMVWVWGGTNQWQTSPASIWCC